MPQKINVDEMPDLSLPIVSDVYLVNCTGITAETTPNGACCDTFAMEILEPASAEVMGKKVGLAGRQFDLRVYYSHAALKRSIEGLRLLGVDFPKGFSPDIPSEDEVKTGAYKRIPEIQDETFKLRGMQWRMELDPDPWYEWTGKAYKSPKALDKDGNPKIKGYGIRADIGKIKTTASEGNRPY